MPQRAKADTGTVTVDFQTGANHAHDRSPQITGTVSDPNAYIVVQILGDAIVADQPDDPYHWIIYRNSFNDLSDGTYDVMVWAISNIDEALIAKDTTKNELEVYDDYTMPPLIFYPPDIDHGNQNDYQVAGIAEKNAIIRYEISDGYHDLVTALSFADWEGNYDQSFDLSSLWDGDIKIRVIADDDHDPSNENESTETIKKDSAINPLPDINTADKIDKSNVNNFSISGSAVSAQKIFYYITDKNGMLIKGSWNVINHQYNGYIDLSNCADGDIKIKMIDEGLGETSDFAEKTVVKDTWEPTECRIPTITDLQYSDKIGQNNAADFTVTGKTSPNTIVDYAVFIDGDQVSGSVTSDNNGDFKAAIDVSSLPDGELTLQLHAYNDCSEACVSKKIEKNTVPPECPGITFTNQTITTNSVDVFFTGNTDPGTKVNYKITDIDGHSISGFVTADQNGDFELNNVDLSSFVNGILSVKISVMDEFGNTCQNIFQSVIKNVVASTIITTATGTEITTTSSVVTLPQAGAAMFNWWILLIVVFTRLFVAGLGLVRRQWMVRIGKISRALY